MNISTELHTRGYGHLSGMAYHSGHPGDGIDGGVDLRALLAGVWRRRATIFGFVVASVLAALAFVMLATPRYSSEAQVMVEDRESAFTRALADRPAAPPDLQAVESEVQVVLSRDVAARVIDELGLLQRADFNPSARAPTLWRRAAMWLGFESDPRSQKARERVLAAYYKNLTVFQVPRSRVITIRFSWYDPQTPAEIANAVARTYVASTQAAKFEATNQATRWLGEQVDQLREKVTTAELAVEQFRAQSGLLQGATGTLGRQELSELNTQIAAAAGERSRAQASAQAIRDMLERNGGIETAPEVLGSQLIQRLREQQVTLRRQIADLSVTYLPGHPRMRRLRAEMSGLESQIRREALKIVEGLEEQAQAAGNRERALRERLAQLKSRAALTNQDEVRLKALEREATANRTLLESFLNRFREASARTDMAALPAGARVISTAEPRTTRTFPRKGPTLLLAVIGSLMLGVVFAFVLEMFGVTAPRREPAPDRPRGSGTDNARPRPEAVSNWVAGNHPGRSPGVNAPAVASAAVAAVPPEPEQVELPESDPERFEDADPPVAAGAVGPDPITAGPEPDDLPPAAEDFVSLAQIVTRTTERLASHRVLLCSGPGAVGQSEVAEGLGRALSESGRRVLLIDADFSHGRILRQHGSEARAGLAELLRGEASFKQLVCEDAAQPMHVLPAGAELAGAQQLLDSERMDVILGALEKAYHHVIVNAPADDDSAMDALYRRATLAVLLIGAQGDGAQEVAAVRRIANAGCERILPVATAVHDRRLVIHPGEVIEDLGEAA